MIPQILCVVEERGTIFTIMDHRTGEKNTQMHIEGTQNTLEVRTPHSNALETMKLCSNTLATNRNPLATA